MADKQRHGYSVTQRSLDTRCSQCLLLATLYNFQISVAECLAPKLPGRGQRARGRRITLHFVSAAFVPMTGLLGARAWRWQHGWIFFLFLQGCGGVWGGCNSSSKLPIYDKFSQNSLFYCNFGSKMVLKMRKYKAKNLQITHYIIAKIRKNYFF